MKKIFFLPAQVSIIVLFLLQMSCTTGRYVEDSDAKVMSDVEQAGESVSDEVEDASKRDQYLGGKHIEIGVECINCHTGESEEVFVSTAICLGCHPSAPEATYYVDPHNGHMVFSECGDCHHAHSPSQNQCDACHYFGLEIP